MSDDLYRDELLDHYYASPYRGEIENPDLTAELDNPLCGDHVRLQLKVGPGDRVSQVRFDGDGCVISQATSSLLAERIEGATLEEVRKVSADEMVEILNVPLTPARLKCGLLAWRTLQRALLGVVDPCP